MTAQSQAVLQAPYRKKKLKQRKKTISFKIYLLLHFSSNLLQIFTVESLYNKKKLFVGFKKKFYKNTFFGKYDFFFNFCHKNFIF